MPEMQETGGEISILNVVQCKHIMARGLCMKES